VNEREVRQGQKIDCKIKKDEQIYYFAGIFLSHAFPSQAIE